MDAGHLFIYEYYLGRLIPRGVAQLGEHLPCKQGVRGSNPLISIRSHKLRPDENPGPVP